MLTLFLSLLGCSLLTNPQQSSCTVFPLCLLPVFQPPDSVFPISCPTMSPAPHSKSTAPTPFNTLWSFSPSRDDKLPFFDRLFPTPLFHHPVANPSPRSARRASPMRFLPNRVHLAQTIRLISYIFHESPASLLPMVQRAMSLLIWICLTRALFLSTF